MLNKIIKFFLENRLVTILIILTIVGWGLITAPFGWKTGLLPSDPVPVDAIPDIGENQQIVFTQWMGRSPQDIEDQVTYPLTTSLLGIHGVKAIRSSSIFGFSSIYIIFKENIDFYWSRSRIIEKLNSLPVGLLPDDVQPTLGPDATALGQVYWYTLEGQDKEGNPTGGWDLHEIRKTQDYYVKYKLNAVDGVSEVASIGGHIQEYQIDVNPDALNIYGVPLYKVINAVKKSNKDVGAKTIEINKAEYLVRGLGYLKSIEEIEKAVVAINDNVPIRIKDIGVVSLGPATRRGLLDKEGAEVVGGVVVAQYGANPLQTINKLKEKIAEIALGLPKKTLANGVESQLTIVPFYDRTQLIYETLGTLEEALSLEIIITILVVIVMMLSLRVSVLISSILPIAILMVFISMRYFGVDANIVALSGIAIAIGTMVDLGIIISDNIIKHLKDASSDQKLINTIYIASSEVSSAIITAVATTIVSFIPVFTMEGPEGKLFKPLAYTKTFALVASLIVVITILPTIAHWAFGINFRKHLLGKIFNGAMIVGGFIIAICISAWGGLTLLALGLAWYLVHNRQKHNIITQNLSLIIVLISVGWLLAKFWMPLGSKNSIFINFTFVLVAVSIVLLFFYLLEKYYSKILGWCLANKLKFLSLPSIIILLGFTTWIGFDNMFGFVAKGFEQVNTNIRTMSAWSYLSHSFPGIGKEFMPSLDEGSFLFMPTSMPHAGFEQNKQVVQQLDMLISSIPEVELSVGKMGRVESALDPAPISMYENIINYKPEYLVNKKGQRERYKTNNKDDFILSSGDTISNNDALIKGVSKEDLILDKQGNYFRNWRQQIQSIDDIWNEIVKVSAIPGVTSAPKLQPIETRLIMLQTGMRAPMGIKVFGSSLKVIEGFAIQLESILKNVPSVKADAVIADRVIGKPYLQLHINRDAISRYGLTIEDVQNTIETAIGGQKVTTTIEGRQRFSVRVRYPRELRDDPHKLKKVYITTPSGIQVPIGELVDIKYARGPQMIKSEDTFLVCYVLFDKKYGFSEVEVVEEAQRAIQYKIDEGDLVVPSGLNYAFSGSYENQIRAERRLSIIIPLVLIIIHLILYFQFKSVSISLMIFSGIAMAFSGGFLMLWLYGIDWFGNFSVFGVNMRELFQIHPINLSVAVWIGFIALFGIATDDGVLICTYLKQSFGKTKIGTISEIRIAVIKAGKKRIKPATMTSATTIIALLPILTSTGRGAGIMIPMAIPAIGGMFVASITCFIVPVLYCMREERKHNKKQK